MAYVRKRNPARQPESRLVTSSPSLSATSTVAREADAATDLGEHGDEAAKFADEWLWFSDLCCGEVSSQKVAEAEPYICFYERA